MYVTFKLCFYFDIHKSFDGEKSFVWGYWVLKILIPCNRIKSLSEYDNYVIWRLNLFYLSFILWFHATESRVYYTASTKYYGKLTFPLCLFTFFFYRCYRHPVSFNNRVSIYINGSINIMSFNLLFFLFQ